MEIQPPDQTELFAEIGQAAVAFGALDLNLHDLVAAVINRKHSAIGAVITQRMNVGPLTELLAGLANLDPDELALHKDIRRRIAGLAVDLSNTVTTRNRVMHSFWYHVYEDGDPPRISELRGVGVSPLMRRKAGRQVQNEVPVTIDQVKQFHADCERLVSAIQQELALVMAQPE